MSEQFIVSARKYRPATFESVVGQKAVTDTLKNAIRTNKLAQAFLFCGPRGVGKTTCARILAKAVNAADPDNLEKLSEDQLNIFELDAASNNSVDDIRNLIDQVRIAPAAGKKFKVYIIDEVHMLSAQAFNAFLKTLEEPPAYAIFVLATTEKHKILPTILSRCQVFDFQRIKIQDMTEHLQYIAEKEGIQADKEALHIIATKADGGLRDALSIFDQMVAFGGTNITYDLVIENLNLLDYEYYFKITDALVDGNISDLLLTFDEILSKGFDGHNFIVGLGDHFRNLLVGFDPRTRELIVAGEQLTNRYSDQAVKAGTQNLIRWLKSCNKADTTYKISKHPRLLIELALIEMSEIAGLEKKKVSEPSSVKASNKPTAPAAPVKTAAAPPISQEKKQDTAQVTTPAPAAKPVSKSTPTPTENSGEPKKFPSLGISIKKLKNQGKAKDGAEGASEELSAEERAKMPREAVSLEMLLLKWDEYALRVKAKPDESFFSTLKLSNPKLEGETIVFGISNKVQEKDFEINRQEMLDFLRSELKNYSLDLKLEMGAPIAKALLYSDEDRLRAMVEKNPSLGVLISKLGLDL